jgi:hypothetical protein
MFSLVFTIRDSAKLFNNRTKCRYKRALLLIGESKLKP